MTIAGADYSFSHPDVAALKAAGISFACRYLSTDPSKNLTAVELASLHGAGIAVVLNWETTAQMALRGYQGGLSDAKAARAQATALGAPASVPIYYSVDFADSAAQIPVVLDYLHGAADAEGSKDKVGVYGGYATAAAAHSAGFNYLWQTYAWSGTPTQWLAAARIRQTRNDQSIGGASVDLDEAMFADYGQWSAPAPPSVSPPVLREGSSGTWDGILQRSLMLAGQLPGPVDSRFGTRTLAALLSFQRSRGLTPDGIAGPLTWAALQERTRAVQAALAAHGTSPGAIDAVAGPETSAALVRFQQAHGLAADAVAGPRTSAALGIAP